MPVFANPLGLLALLGIPAVLAIHFLQRKTKELVVSTLFLLEHTRREAAGGRNFERIIPSIPLWMQLLAVILLAWFLSEPRYAKSGSVQRVAIVVDSSASMTVFREKALDRLEKILPELRGEASAIELTVLESAPNRARLYTGSSIVDLKTAMEKWQPHDGPLDPTQSIRLARSLVSREGTVLYLTDTPVPPLPFDASLLAVGETIENVGFTGVSFATEEGTLIWRALVKNHSDKAADRTWTLQSSKGSTEARPLHLGPGALVTLQAAFPKDAENVRIALSPDRFPMDDVLPIVVPKPKTIRLFTTASRAFASLSEKLRHALDEAETAKDAADADLTIASYNPLDPAPQPGNAIVFVEDETRTGAWLKGGIITESHALMDGLNWQSLLARETIQLERKPEDKILLWQDKRPLIFLRETGNIRQLFFNFDPSLSNIEKQPAFIVLLHRFAESIRSARVAPVSENLETGQPLDIASLPGVPLKTTAASTDGKPLPKAVVENPKSAITSPGFLTIQQGEQVLLTAAVHFGDPRESDFSACGASEPRNSGNSASIERHTKPDPFWRLWLLLLLAAMLVSWRYTESKPVPA